jgi:hypothetical protein
MLQLIEKKTDVVFQYDGVEPYIHNEVTLLRRPVFSEERCRGSLASIHSFNRLLGHLPRICRNNLSVAEFPVAGRSFFARGCGEIYHRALGCRDPACLYRQRREPGSG